LHNEFRFYGVIFPLVTLCRCAAAVSVTQCCRSPESAPARTLRFNVFCSRYICLYVLMEGRRLGTQHSATAYATALSASASPCPIVHRCLYLHCASKRVGAVI
ncbi:hypothetical protein K438DRAFT_1869044, partial [Mycena galopus ATCC 62051]